MKKRILAALLVFLLVIQSNLIFTVSADESEMYAPYVTSEGLLEALNITTGGSDYTQTVTRADAAAYIAVMLGEGNNYQNFRGIFSDVPSSNANALAIEKLADLGIVRGDGNFAFRPDDNLTYNEAAIIFVNVLGYALIGNSNISEAKRAGILNNIKSEFDVVNLGDLFVMMYNTLMASPVVQTSYGANGEYQKSEQTLLYKVYSVVHADGTIVKNDLTSLWLAKEEAENTIELKTADGSIEIKADNISALREDLGKRVRAYFYFNEDKSVYEYVHHNVTSSNKTVKFALEQLEPGKTNFSTRKIAYYNQGGNKAIEVSLSNDYNIIYNNAAYENNKINFAELEGKAGSIELIDSNSDNAYETVKVKVYDTVVVESISTSSHFITDKFDSSIRIDIDEESYEKIFIYDAAGNEVTFEAIVPGSVVSYATSKTYDGIKVLELRVSNDVTNGRITQYKKGEFAPYIIVDGNKQLNLYDRAAYDKEGNKISYTVNSNIIVYSDVFGNAVYISDDKSRDLQYGIIIGMHSGGGSLTSEVDIRLITTSGEIVEAKLDKKAIIDGDSYSGKITEAYDYLSKIKTNATFTGNGSTLPGPVVTNEIIPVRYKIGDEKTIKIIDTVQPGTGSYDGLRLVATPETYAGNGGNVLGFTIPYNADATLLEISDKNLNNIDAFNDINNITAKIVGTTFKNGELYHVMAYTANEESDFAEFIISFADSKITLDDTLFVVDEIIKAYNEDKDEVMNQVCGFKNGTYTEAWIDDSIAVDGINKGDTLKCAINQNNTIMNVVKVLTRSEGKINYQLDTTHMNVINADSIRKSLSGGSLCGYVYSREGTLIRTNSLVVGEISQITEENFKTYWKDQPLFFTNVTSAAVVVVDDENDEIYAGTVDDILDCETFEDEASLLVMRWRSNSVKEIVVYK